MHHPAQRRPVDAALARRQLVDSLAAQGILVDPRVREAMLAIPREAFTEDPFSDAPQPIGAGQTISAPHMVAMMAQWLDVHPGHRVLEIGGGSGYHAAILARLAAPGTVISVEIVPELASRARRTLADLGIASVEVVEADGSEGFPRGAPYDRVSVAAGAPRVPPPLVEQLAPGGKLLIPVGPLDMQTMLEVRAYGSEVPLSAVRFVPLRGRFGWP